MLQFRLTRLQPHRTGGGRGCGVDDDNNWIVNTEKKNKNAKTEKIQLDTTWIRFLLSHPMSATGAEKATAATQVPKSAVPKGEVSLLIQGPKVNAPQKKKAAKKPAAKRPPLASKRPAVSATSDRLLANESKTGTSTAMAAALVTDKLPETEPEAPSPIEPGNEKTAETSTVETRRQKRMAEDMNEPAPKSPQKRKFVEDGVETAPKSPKKKRVELATSAEPATEISSTEGLGPVDMGGRKSKAGELENPTMEQERGDGGASGAEASAEIGSRSPKKFWSLKRSKK